MTAPIEARVEGPGDQSRRSRLVGAIPAFALTVLCIVLWQLWVKPTMHFTTDKVATPAEPQSLDDLHVRGSKNASVGLVVFSDFECPVCGRFARDVLLTIVQKYVVPGRVLLAFSDVPLESIHPSAFRRAVAAECAGRQGHFWEVHDRLFAGQASPSVEQDSVDGLDTQALALCLSSGPDKAVRARLMKAQALGINSTPSLFVGRIENGRLTVTDAIGGFRSVEQLSAVLDLRLRR